MNDKFNNLPYEKQIAIINSGLEVFSNFDYKKASTEEIAYKAGISKGLLFHYFNNKASFFEYLYLYAQGKLEEGLSDTYQEGKEDFFEVIERLAYAKCKLLQEYPYILNFLIAATYSKDETVQKVLATLIKPLSGENILNQMTSKHQAFASDTISVDIIELLAYALEGYLYRVLKTGSKIQLEDIMGVYIKWINLLKKAYYKDGGRK